ncbi:ABC transporter permease [Dyella caseinilytica]|uniref:ABC transporter permease n=1 Tax=Dyella caseinilytica TaxID=1849581 RepID=A0ABX7GQZ3_9GAMM|nr:ABC transporter permease [Dyella caseinilytica]QRN52776.1 ABC transporter permease [Dyella caseinilytica]GGA08644.1 ABC transporter ATP-binding protein [Dyella caseinilytica]
MLAYYLRLGLRSLRRNPILTALMVLAIGVGIAASMTTYAVFSAVSANPLPGKSSQLFVPTIDAWGPQGRIDGGDMPDALTYTDAMALMHDRKGVRQTAIYPLSYTVIPGDVSREPFHVDGYAAYADFFPMFQAPFVYGSGWDRGQDDAHAAVVVISNQLNQQLFGGANSVGRTLRLDDHDYQIVGVMADWNPRPRYYDVNNSDGFSDPPDFILPFTHAVDIHSDTDGNDLCRGTRGRDPGWDGWLRSGCAWVSLWVELPDSAAAQAYRSYLEGYAGEQNRAGRFHWPPDVALFDLTQWLQHEKVVPPETRMSLLLSLGFLLVCLVNTVGLLLAKFMRRAGEIGVRRALGASRREIWMQFLAEAAMVGVAGGVAGLLFTGVGMSSIGLVFDPDIARLAHMSMSLIGLTLLSAVLATVATAFYPTWRAAHVQPAWQLKSN